MSTARLKKAQEKRAASKQASANNTQTRKRVDIDASDQEGLLTAALEHRRQDGQSGGEALANSRIREQLINAQYDFFDARELILNEENDYHITDDDIEGLATLIYESKNTDPILVRGTDRGYEVIDGERRTRAHLLLGKLYGEQWYMMSAKYFEPGTLSDHDARIMMDAENIGQRVMTQTERLRGVARMGERIKARRQEHPELYKGRLLREILAAQFGVSPRTAETDYNIGKNLEDHPMALLEKGAMTKAAADAVARLEPEDQEEIAQQVELGTLQKDAIEQEAKYRSGETHRKPAKKKSTNDFLQQAQRSLKNAIKANDGADPVLLANIASQIDFLNNNEKDADQLLIQCYMLIKEALRIDGNPDAVLLRNITALIDTRTEK